MKRMLLTILNNRTFHNLKRLSEECGQSLGDCIDMLISEYVNSKDPAFLRKIDLAKSVALSGTIRNAGVTTNHLIQNAILDDADKAYLKDGEAEV